MPLRHLPATATPDEVVAALRTDGCCIVDNLVDPQIMDRVDAEMSPYIDLTPSGRDDFIGRVTRRTGAMVGRSPASRNLIMHPLILGATGQLLDKASAFHLHLTQVISIFPGETPQPLHRDEYGWDFRSRWTTTSSATRSGP